MSQSQGAQVQMDNRRRRIARVPKKREDSDEEFDIESVKYKKKSSVKRPIEQGVKTLKRRYRVSSTNINTYMQMSLKSTLGTERPGRQMLRSMLLVASDRGRVWPQFFTRDMVSSLTQSGE